MERIKIIYENGYYCAEKTESKRIIKLLEHLPEQWTPAGKLAKHIKEKLEPTLKTIRLLAGATKIIRKTSEASEYLTEKPILDIKKDYFNKKANIGKKYLKAPIYIRRL